MSFSMTTPQMYRRGKIVTRRCGWFSLKPGKLVRAVVKGMGLKRGEKMQPIAFLVVVGVRAEKLREMSDRPEYGFAECELEGFGDDPRLKWPSEFVSISAQRIEGAWPKRSSIESSFVSFREGVCMREDLELWQIMADAVSCGLSIRFSKTDFGEVAQSFEVVARGNGARSGLAFERKIVMDFGYLLHANQPGEFLRVRVGQVVSECLRWINGQGGAIPQDVRERWSL